MPLELPGEGYGPARRPTVRRTELLTDWIEAQAYVDEGFLSKQEVVDRIAGTPLARDQDEAWLIVNEAFVVGKSRGKHAGVAYPFEFDADVIEYQGGGLAYIFLLLISLPEQFLKLRKEYDQSFRDLFEEVAAEALGKLLPNWTVLRTGWEGIAAAGRGAVMARVAELARGKIVDDAVFPNANDAQVDLAAARSFADGRGAHPIVMGQCATGVTDWKDKAIRPNLDRWRKAVIFPTAPAKLFAVPFAFDDTSFREASSESDGLVLERIRIVEPLSELSEPLRAKLEAWIATEKPRLPALQ